MKMCIARDNSIVSNPGDDLRKLRKGERYVKYLVVNKAHDPILYTAVDASLLNLSMEKAVYSVQYIANDLSESNKVAKDLLATESQRIRESGFISTVTGQWTGETTKDNIIRSSMVSNSSMNAKNNGKGTDVRKYKTTQGHFIELTNNQITDLDEEINGSEGFIQQCYDREAAITELIDAAGPNPENVRLVYDAEISTGFPAYGG